MALPQPIGQPPSPFVHYPHSGLALVGRPKNPSNCRHGKGLELQRLTGQTACSYCGISLVDGYYHWLLMSVDHVVPSREAQRLGIPSAYAEDFINLVLCCSGCNGFGNRYKIPLQPKGNWEFGEFIELRDRTYASRFLSIASRRAVEQHYFASKQWE